MDYPHDFQLIDSYQEGQNQELMHRAELKTRSSRASNRMRFIRRTVYSLLLHTGRWLEDLGYQLRTRYEPNAISDSVS